MKRKKVEVEKEKVKLEKKKVFKDELENIFNFATDSFDRGNAIIERYNAQQCQDQMRETEFDPDTKATVSN